MIRMQVAPVFTPIPWLWGCLLQGEKMRVLIAIDSLKGSLTSMEAGNTIAEGIKRVYPKAELHVSPLADGGEGTAEALTAGLKGSLQSLTVTGPLGAPISAGYGILPDKRTAVLEMAAAAGITLVEPEKRNPMKTTTYGVGELIRDAIKKGCRHFIVGIGGSVTNDGGIGMLQALGFGMLDQKGRQVSFGGEGLSMLHQITAESVMEELKECTFRIACDVTNPLCGPLGASAVYGPQKGADPQMISELDGYLGHFALLAKGLRPSADPEVPGTGAAGGLGYAFLTFTNAVLESGIRIVMEETGLEEHVKNADLVVTGEGCLDGQTVQGKAPIGVAGLAKKYGKPVIAFSGIVKKDAAVCNEAGIDAFFPILRRVGTLEEAMNPKNARENLLETSEQVFRLWKAAGKSLTC
jgi:glycerate kinase